MNTPDDWCYEQFKKLQERDPRAAAFMQTAAFIYDPFGAVQLLTTGIEKRDSQIADLKKATRTWQPIETAPKDGSEVLVTFCENANAIPPVYFREVGWWGTPSVYAKEKAWCIGLGDSNAGYTVYETCIPTHWMPLPEPPAPEPAPEPDHQKLMACVDNRTTHDTASLKALGGKFYTISGQEWCDTATKSWRKEGPDLWILFQE